MIDENISRLRKMRGMSQEELAVGLHVVRQTVSKWEQGKSVPDAEAVIRMAELLEVSVHEILGTGPEQDTERLAEELARANALLAEKAREERQRKLAGEKRGLILMLSIFALIAALVIQNAMASLVVVGLCTAAAVIILYRNLALLTSLTTDDGKLGVLKATTICNLIVFVVGILAAVLIGLDVIRLEDDGRGFAMALIVCVMVFSGIISPKLPFTRHTGLRLPWTVVDEDTWNVAHRTLGFTALPIAVLYVAGGLTIADFEGVTLCAVGAWVGVPAVISYVYYRRKMQGKI